MYSLPEPVIFCLLRVCFPSGVLTSPIFLASFELVLLCNYVLYG